MTVFQSGGRRERRCADAQLSRHHGSRESPAGPIQAGAIASLKLRQAIAGTFVIVSCIAIMVVHSLREMGVSGSNSQAPVWRPVSGRIVGIVGADHEFAAATVARPWQATPTRRRGQFRACSTRTDKGVESGRRKRIGVSVGFESETLATMNWNRWRTSLEYTADTIITAKRTAHRDLKTDW